MSHIRIRTRCLVLFIGDFFHPFHDFPVQMFLNGDVGHRRPRSSAVPMLFSRGAPDHVTGSYFQFWTAFALHPAAAGRNDQSLTERMGMPCRSGTRLERDVRA